MQYNYTVIDYIVIGNLPVNWPKLLGSFQKGFTRFFNVFGMSFCITSAKPNVTV